MRVNIQDIEKKMEKAEKTLQKAERIISSFELAKSQLDASRKRERVMESEISKKNKHVKLMSMLLITSILCWLVLVITILIRF